LTIALRELFAEVPHAPKRTAKGKTGRDKGKRRAGE
jgi:hypothetical protein